jgi:hypothetical protein
MAVLEAYNVCGIAWTGPGASMGAASKTTRPVRESLRESFAGLINMLDQEKMRATYTVVKSHEKLVVPLTQTMDGTNAAHLSYATTLRIDLLARLSRLERRGQGERND